MKKHILLAVAVVLLCTLMAGVVSETEYTVSTSKNLTSKISNISYEDIIKLTSGEYALTTGLKIEKKITLTAADPANKPRLTVTLAQASGNIHGGIWIAKAGVKLDNPLYHQCR